MDTEDTLANRLPAGFRAVQMNPPCDGFGATGPCGSTIGYFDSRASRIFCASCGRTQMPPDKRRAMVAQNRAMVEDHRNAVRSGNAQRLDRKPGPWPQ